MKSKFHVVNDQPTQYDMIIGRDLLSEFGIDLEFSTNQIWWDEAIIPFRDSASTFNDVFIVKDSASVTQSTSRIQQILDAKYEPADLTEIVKSCSHLDENEKRRSATAYTSMKNCSMAR